MSMPEPSETVAATQEQATTVVETQIAKANQRAANFVFGAQKLMLEELVFVSNELVERAQTEMHLLSEFVSKMAGAHCVKDVEGNVRGTRQAPDRVCSSRLRSAGQEWRAADRSHCQPVQEPSAGLIGTPCR